ncbi:4-coumarate-CoA ligase [Microdochium bolleyi]|uniref:4-coumarate-CoA ligase n=1 Tax=Microdochium bolleyi TaxID=196109 RepID=A0A136JA76_9PEZI|nr:4-coumarate-CoA ligase [Microdochium bolleyi]
MSRIYKHPTHAKPELPDVDLCTLLFDHELALAQDDTVLHVEAANPANRLTKAMQRALVERIAHGLRTHFQVGARGPNEDVVTVISHGQILVPSLFYGVIAAGGVYSAASPSSTADELARQIQTGRSRLVVCGAEHADIASRAAAKLGIPPRRVLVLDSTAGAWSLRNIQGDDTTDALSPPHQRLTWARITDPKALRESLVVILWSSGTTGLPKGVMLSHANLVAETVITSILGREAALNELVTNPPDANQPPPPAYRTLAHLPISHIAGLWGYLVGPQYAGGTVHWMRRYSWDGLLRHAREFEITIFYTVPSIFLRISKSPDVTDQFAHVVGAVTGAAPMDGTLQRSANARLAGGREQLLGQTWGLSETTGAVTAQPRGEPDDTGSIGQVLPGVELRIVDEDYRDVEPGVEGELLVRSPLVMRGYFDNPEATRAAFHEGWFCTGDIGVLRQGKFYVVDRKKELLKYKGLQVAPAELEGILFEHPQIREAAVIGLPDPAAGDLPRAYVVPWDKARITEAEVKAYVAERVAPYKQLRGGVVFVDEIPKNAIGKFLRKDLRERAKREVAGNKSKL